MQDQKTDSQVQPSPPGRDEISQRGGTLTDSQMSQDGVTVYQPSQSETVNAPIPKGIRFRVPKIMVFALVVLGFLGILFFVVSRLKPNAINFIGKRGEITWWGHRDKSIVQPLIEQYQEENPRVTINYVVQSKKDYRERLTNALAKGEGPDIFRFHNTWVPMFINELDNLPSSVMSESEFSQTFYPVITSDLTTNKGIVGIPLGYDAITLYINEDIFAAAGRTPPVMWDEVRLLAKDLTSRNKEGTIIQSGVALGRTDNVDHWEEILGLMMIQDGVNMSAPKGKLAEGVMTFYTRFTATDKVWDSSLPPSTVAFGNGKLAMYFGPSWRATEINKINPNLRFKTVPLPQLRKDDPKEPDVSYTTYWVEGVWTKSSNKDIAWDFLKFMSEKESLVELFKNSESISLIGEPYPRLDMNNLLIEHPILGSIVALAQSAKSWYLVGHTNDGPTGINSQLSQYYKDAVDSYNKRKAGKALETLTDGVSQVLIKYGIRIR